MVKNILSNIKKRTLFEAIIINLKTKQPKNHTMRKILLLRVFALFMLTVTTAWAQERNVSGKVTSIEDGGGLPGVNVVLKGTTTGTVTDAEGKYSLSVPASGGVLDFSFIGFVSQQVEIGSRSVMDIQLVTNITELSEIIITSYGQQEKRTLTGSVAVIKNEAFQNLPIQSIDRAIQGRAAGVQISSASGAPGSALTVRIRGIGSVNASNDPLWIIDGVQMGRFGQSTQGSSNPLAPRVGDAITSRARQDHQPGLSPPYQWTPTRRGDRDGVALWYGESADRDRDRPADASSWRSGSLVASAQS